MATDPNKKKKSKSSQTLDGLRKRPYYETRISQTQPKDTVHVRTTGGYKIAVKKDSPYSKQAKKSSAVINSLRPTKGNLTAKTDPLSVKNYRAPKKKK